MTDTETPELLHREQLDARGNPTGYALCDKGDGTFPGGLLAHNSGLANCEACEDWEPDDSDEEDAEPLPWPHRLARYGGYALHAAKARPSGAFETACGWLSGPGDNKHYDDQRPVTCRECKRRLAREEREEAQ